MIPNITPAAIRIMPPIFAHFHAITRIASKMNDGTRCIAKASRFCHKVRSGENESSANKLIKRIATMHRIRGVHFRILADVFIAKFF